MRFFKKFITVMSFLILPGCNDSIQRIYAPDEVSTSLKLTRKNLFYYMELQEIKFPEIVLKQAILETGNFTSDLCCKYNNLFGLYDTIHKRYYKFYHWTQSVIAYKKWIQYRYVEGEGYYHFLIRIKYARDPDYIAKLKSIQLE